MRDVIVTVNDKMQRGHRYARVAPIGRGFHPDFQPDLTPKQMLELGVFCGKNMIDTRDEFPRSWFARAKLAPKGRDCSLNFFLLHGTPNAGGGSASNQALEGHATALSTDPAEL
jgi:hypothetical protein